MIYVTTTGSVYQVDHEGKRARRLRGLKPPTERTGTDGEWKSFVHFRDADEGLWFDWNGLGNGTLTSRIVERREEN